MAQTLRSEGMRIKGLKNVFPATRRDVDELKRTASDAVNDLSSSASVHASRVKNQIMNLAQHVQDEGTGHMKSARGRATSLVSKVTDFATERPLVCIGAALAIGLLIGLSRRRNEQ